MRQGVPTIINPYDLFALEEAMRWRDRFGGEVTVLTMGPPMAEDSLRKALTFGANRAVLLTDRFFAGSDTLATSYALAGALQKIEQEFGKPAMIFTGKQTIDGDTAQVGPGVAKRLGLNQLTYVARIVELVPEEDRITVERRAEGGVQVLSTRLPVLITMLEGANEIRRGSLDDAFRAARAKIDRFPNLVAIASGYIDKPVHNHLGRIDVSLPMCRRIGLLPFGKGGRGERILPADVVPIIDGKGHDDGVGLSRHGGKQ